MAVYQTIGNYKLPSVLVNHIIVYRNNSELSITKIDGSIVVEWRGREFGDTIPVVKATIQLHGDTLELREDGGLSGRITGIDTYVRSFEHHSASFSQVRLNATKFSEMLDDLMQGEYQVFFDTMMAQAGRIIGSADVENFTYDDLYPAEHIHLRGGDDFYHHPEGPSNRSLIIDGGRGSKDMFYTDTRGGTYLNFQEEIFIDVTGTQHRVRNFERAEGANGDDVMVGNLDRPNSFFGKNGDDLIEGGHADDYMEGGLGFDRLIGRKGDDLFQLGEMPDFIHGGPGSDTVSYWRYSRFFETEVNLETGFGGLSHVFIKDQYISIENAIGSSNADTLIGNSGANRLEGMEGNDLVIGKKGKDHLIGGQGEDILRGQAGADRIEGGYGDDRLEGGTGRDVFVFLSDFGNDTLLDFDVEKDRLEFSGEIWGTQLTKAEIVATYGGLQDGHVVFDFGGANTIHLLNLTDLTGLENSLIVV